MIFNKDSWDALTPESQKIIEEVVIEWEAKSWADRQKDKEADAAELTKRGMEFVSMKPEAATAYLKMADDAAWGRMKGRLDKMGGDNDYDALRKHYAGE